ncbi:MAG: hypothetical protein KC619_21255 [Myxococcales bacterium]|nr:hypothetical protein [Myxococcales bacterium]
MGDTDNDEIGRAAAAALEAANTWRGERWFEAADIQLVLELNGGQAPVVTGWTARLGNVEIAGAATAVIALEMLRDVFRNTTASRRTRR